MKNSLKKFVSIGMSALFAAGCMTVSAGARGNGNNGKKNESYDDDFHYVQYHGIGNDFYWWMFDFGFPFVDWYKDYTVEFFINNGTDEVIKGKANLGEKIKGPSISRNCYSLLGWSADPSAEAPDYGFDEDIEISSDIKLYAVWQEEEHSYGDWEIIDNSTCNCCGSKMHICESCGKIEYESIPKSDEHCYGEWEIVTEADCITEGKEIRVCECCGDVDSKIIPAEGHSYDEYVFYEETHPHYNCYICKKCNKVVRNYDETRENIKGCHVCDKSMIGDINGDGFINGKDMILLLKHVADWNVPIVCENSDCCHDGYVNGHDVVLLLKYLAMWDVKLG